MASELASPGTKPYQCDHEKCTNSFSTNQKLRAHMKVHEGMFIPLQVFRSHLLCRKALYMRECYVPRPSRIGVLPNLDSTKHHIRTVHHPTCPYEERAGRMFSAQKGVRAHLKLHEQRVTEEHERASSEKEDVALPRKCRRGGEVGCVWKCEVEGCTKDFKSVRGF